MGNSDTPNHTEIIDESPILSEDEIVNNITLVTKPSLRRHSIYIYIYFLLFFLSGTYQLKRARSYAEEKASTTNLTGSVNYTIHRYKEFPNLIRVPTQSAHVGRVKYHPILRFTAEEISDWWCDCTAGNRFIGCCSHIASTIWFLSFERWQTQSRRMPSETFINFIIDAAALPELFDSTDNSSNENEHEDKFRST